MTIKEKSLIQLINKLHMYIPQSHNHNSLNYFEQATNRCTLNPPTFDLKKVLIALPAITIT